MPTPETTCLGIYREPIFSPGKIHQDAAILEAALLALGQDHGTAAIQLHAPGALDEPLSPPAVVLTMAQSEEALLRLEAWQQRGIRVVNTVQAVRNCYRKPLIRLLEAANLPIPPSQILPIEKVTAKVRFERGERFWLKRGDVHAVQAEDVVPVASPEELRRALAHFAREGIDEILVQNHVEGEVVKFYGVGQDDFFIAYQSATGEDVTSFLKELAPMARAAAAAVGLEVYGGDAVWTADGRLVLIDLNDWPSFSRCCEPAARSIAGYIARVIAGGEP